MSNFESLCGGCIGMDLLNAHLSFILFCFMSFISVYIGVDFTWRPLSTSGSFSSLHSIMPAINLSTTSALSKVIFFCWSVKIQNELRLHFEKS